MDQNSPIALFDSGLGGISVLQEMVNQMPDENYLFYGDSANNPYGTKSREEITQRCIEICDDLMEQGCKSIVIACNTATSACVNLLRKRYPIDIIGMEPALKLAAETTEKGVIAVWATDFTLREKKFRDLMDRFSSSHEIVKVPCPKLVRLVEDGKLDDISLVDSVLHEYLEKSCPEKLSAIVLGCTHFVFFARQLKKMLPEGVKIVDGNEGTARHVKFLLEKRGLLNHEGGNLRFENSLPEKAEQSKELFSRMEDTCD